MADMLRVFQISVAILLFDSPVWLLKLTRTVDGERTVDSGSEDRYMCRSNIMTHSVGTSGWKIMRQVDWRAHEIWDHGC